MLTFRIDMFSHVCVCICVVSLLDLLFPTPLLIELAREKVASNCQECKCHLIFDMHIWKKLYIKMEIPIIGLESEVHKCWQETF